MEKCFNIAGAISPMNGNPVLADRSVRKEGLLPPPVGTSDWARFLRDSYCVDKTLILRDLIDSKSRMVLFTRPRRFGKTTMLEMIRAFYEPETFVDGRGMVKTEEFFTNIYPEAGMADGNRKGEENEDKNHEIS